MNVKFDKNPIRSQEAQRRVAQNISHLRDKGNIFVQESATRYRPRNCISILNSQGR